MLKKTLFFVIVIAFGLGTGYFSTPIYNFIWPDDRVAKVRLADIETGTSSEAQTAGQDETPQYITEDKAVNAVKGLPVIQKLQGSAQMEFAVEQKPSAAYPVWLVEVKQKYSDQVPDIMYVQVDAVSGNVLDLTKEEMKISGISLNMTRKAVEKIQGKTRKTKKVFDRELDQNVRIDNYDGLEITYNPKSRVIKISASKPEFLGPRGVKAGDAKERLIQLLGRGRTGPTTVLTYVPLDDESIQLIFKLDNNNISELFLQAASNGI